MLPYSKYHEPPKCLEYQDSFIFLARAAAAPAALFLTVNLPRAPGSGMTATRCACHRPTTMKP